MPRSQDFLSNGTTPIKSSWSECRQSYHFLTPHLDYCHADKNDCKEPIWSWVKILESHLVLWVKMLASHLVLWVKMLASHVVLWVKMLASHLWITYQKGYLWITYQKGSGITVTFTLFHYISLEWEHLCGCTLDHFGQVRSSPEFLKKGWSNLFFYTHNINNWLLLNGASSNIIP